MRFFLTAIAFVCAILWLLAANAACIAESRCDDCGACSKAEICDDVGDIVQFSTASATTVPKTPGSPATDAVAASNAECRDVDICGTMQSVCD